jgi:hypothetical protein
MKFISYHRVCIKVLIFFWYSTKTALSCVISISSYVCNRNWFYLPAYICTRNMCIQCDKFCYWRPTLKLWNKSDFIHISPSKLKADEDKMPTINFFQTKLFVQQNFTVNIVKHRMWTTSQHQCWQSTHYTNMGYTQRLSHYMVLQEHFLAKHILCTKKINNNLDHNRVISLCPAYVIVHKIILKGVFILNFIFH